MRPLPITATSAWFPPWSMRKAPSALPAAAGLGLSAQLGCLGLSFRNQIEPHRDFVGENPPGVAFQFAAGAEITANSAEQSRQSRPPRFLFKTRTKRSPLRRRHGFVKRSPVAPTNLRRGPRRRGSLPLTMRTEMRLPPKYEKSHRSFPLE